MLNTKGQHDAPPRDVNALTRHQCRKLSVAALGLDERTIRRAYANPAAVRESTLLRIAKAASELGFPEPTLAGTTP
jgi:hypothetical protein